MPRHARLDSPGTLHHVIVRGIERRKIVDDDVDRLSPDAIRFSRIPSHIAARNVHSVWLGFTGSIRSNAFPKQSDFRERNNFFGYQMIPDSASRASNTRTFLFVSNGWVRIFVQSPGSSLGPPTIRAGRPDYTILSMTTFVSPRCRVKVRKAKKP